MQVFTDEVLHHWNKEVEMVKRYHNIYVWLLICDSKLDYETWIP